MSMSETIKENLQEDKGYQAFSNLLDMVFEIADELYGKVDNNEGLTDVEFKFLDAFDEYVDSITDEKEDIEEQGGFCKVINKII